MQPALSFDQNRRIYLDLCSPNLRSFCKPDYTIVGPEEPMPAYHNLVWDAWIPVVRLAIQRWQSRQPDPLIGKPKGSDSKDWTRV